MDQFALIAIEPLYERRRNALLTPRKNPSKPWHIVQRIDDPDPVRANRQLLEELENGATGIALVFEGAPNAFGYGLPSTREAVDKVLYGVHLDMIHLRMDVHPKSRACADWFVDYMRPRDVNPKTLSFSLGIDPAATLAGTGRLRMSLAALKASLPQSLSGFFSSDLPEIVLEADGRVYHNAGATEAQELGAMLVRRQSGRLRAARRGRRSAHCLCCSCISVATLAVDQRPVPVDRQDSGRLRRLWARLQEAVRRARDPLAGSDPCRNEPYRMITRHGSRHGTSPAQRRSPPLPPPPAAPIQYIAVLPHTVARGLPDRRRADASARNTQLLIAGSKQSGHQGRRPGWPAQARWRRLTDASCGERPGRSSRRIEQEGGILRKALLDGDLPGRVSLPRPAMPEQRNTVPASAPAWVRRSSLLGRSGRSTVLEAPAQAFRHGETASVRRQNR